nr:MAG TPA: hypothetical protein [Caudoviricetes sp.]
MACLGASSRKSLMSPKLRSGLGRRERQNLLTRS